MEPEGSLPHSQVPATCPYPHQARSSPYPHIALPEDPILPSTPRSPKWSLSLRFPHQTPAQASPLPHTRYTTALKLASFPHSEKPKRQLYSSDVLLSFKTASFCGRHSSVRRLDCKLDDRRIDGSIPGRREAFYLPYRAPTMSATQPQTNRKRRLFSAG